MHEHQLHVLLVDPRDHHILLTSLAQRHQKAPVIPALSVVCWGCDTSDSLCHKSYTIPRINHPTFRFELQQPLSQ